MMSRVFLVAVCFSGLFKPATGLYNVSIPFSETNITGVLNDCPSDQDVVAYLLPGTFSFLQLFQLVHARSGTAEQRMKYSIEGSSPSEVQLKCNKDDPTLDVSTEYNPWLSFSDITMLGCRLIFRGTTRPPFYNSVFRDTGPPHGNTAYAWNSSVLHYVGFQAGPRIEGCTFESNKITPLVIDGCCSSHSALLTDTTFTSNHVELDETACPEDNDDDVFVSAGVVLLFRQVAQSPPDDFLAALDRCTFSNNSVRAYNTCAAAASGAALNIIATWTQPTAATSVFVNSTTFEKNSVKGFNGRERMPVTSSSGYAYAGGAMAVQFRDVSNFSVAIINSTFRDNLASRGGGASFRFSGTSSSNRVNICPTAEVDGGCYFYNNSATTYAEWGEAFKHDDDIVSPGGGVDVVFNNSANTNHVHVYSTQFRENGASEGGGLRAAFHSRHAWAEANALRIDSCNFHANKAITGAALELWSGRLDASVGQQQCTSPRAVIHDSTFSQNVAFFRGAVSVTSIEVHKTGTLRFCNNINSAFVMHHSVAHVNGTLIYADNLAEVGAGLFMYTSQIVFYRNAMANFVHNVALSVGSAMFAYAESRSIQMKPDDNSRCFVVYENKTLAPPAWRNLLSVNFRDNIAGLIGSAIYAADMTDCQDVLDQARNISAAMPWAKFTNNSRNHSLESYSTYDAVSGASGQFFAYPVSNFWRPSILHFWNITDLHGDQQDDVDVSTDVYRLEFLTRDDLALLEVEGNCQALQTPKEQPTFNVTAGIETTFYLVACDQFEQMVLKAKLYPTLYMPSRCLSELNDKSIIITQGSEMKLQNMKLSSMVFASTTPGNISDHDRVVDLRVTVAGATRQVSTSACLTIPSVCLPGYKWGTHPKQPSLHVCKCDTSSVESCTPDGTVTLRSGSWANVNDNKELDVYTCPPNYCRCNGHDDDCSFSMPNDSQTQFSNQCHSRRVQGSILCGRCQGGYQPSLELYHGRCINTTSCFLPKGVALAIAFAGTFLGVTIVLWLDLPLANDLKVFMFFGAMARFLFYPEDDFMIHVNKAEDLNSRFGMLRVVLDIADLSWCTDACFYNWVDNSTDAIAAGFIVPIFAMFLLIVVQFCKNIDFARCCRRFRCYESCTNGEPRRFLSMGSTWNGTWLVVYYCFHHLLSTCILLVQCTHVNGKLVFYWDGEPCLGDKRLPIFIAACVGFLFLLLLLGSVLCLTVDKHKCCFSWCPNVSLQAADVLKIGLKKGKVWWWTWDLWRRGMIVLLFFPINYEYTHWYKQIAIAAALIVILAVHIINMPYSDLTENQEGQQVQSSAIYTVFPGLKRGNRCNYLEIIILIDMIFISALSSGAALNSSINKSNIRKYLLAVCVVAPLVMGGLIVLYKLLMCLKEKYSGSTDPLHEWFSGCFVRCTRRFCASKCFTCLPCCSSQALLPERVATNLDEETRHLLARDELVMGANCYDSLLKPNSA